MKISIIISTIAEWEGVKPLFPSVRIEQFPYGECFQTEINNFNVLI